MFSLKVSGALPLCEELSLVMSAHAGGILRGGMTPEYRLICVETAIDSSSPWYKAHRRTFAAFRCSILVGI